MIMKSKLTPKLTKPGLPILVVRSHHNSNDACVGKTGVIDKIVLKNSIVKVIIDGTPWLLGYRDLQVVGD
jgi:hypothetical protein